MAWEGHPGGPEDWSYYQDQVCDYCGAPRFTRNPMGALQPARKWYYLGARRAVKRWFQNPEFRRLVRQDLDVSDNAYRSSPDFRRIDNGDPATGRWEHGCLSHPHNICVTLTSDAVLFHQSSTKGHTGKSVASSQYLRRVLSLYIRSHISLRLLVTGRACVNAYQYLE